MAEHETGQADFGRRLFLRTVVASAMVGFAAQTGIELAVPARLHAQTNLSPDAALQELIAGNQRFSGNQLTSIEHDPYRPERPNGRQAGTFCGGAFVRRFSSASRTDLRPDDWAHLCHGVAGNIVTPEIIASLEYGVAVLGV